MIRLQVKSVLDNCFEEGVIAGSWSDSGRGKYTVELPRHEGQGDFSSNIALVLAGIEKRNPREIAAAVVEGLAGEKKLFRRVEIAGPGFINFFINGDVWRTLIPVVIDRDEDFGRSEVGRSRKVMVEFVSANPTGPLSIGHGRQAILGDSIARLLEATGHDVFREYYYNDAGRQMRVLGESTRARYLELIGEKAVFPEDGYQGKYIIDIARSLVDERGDSLKSVEDVTPFKKCA
ncbi:arginine--tRNA ligase domain-containing protein [Desulfomarina sp.]